MEHTINKRAEYFKKKEKIIIIAVQVNRLNGGKISIGLVDLHSNNRLKRTENSNTRIIQKWKSLVNNECFPRRIRRPFLVLNFDLIVN
jgi:hypothetical protein